MDMGAEPDKEVNGKLPECPYARSWKQDVSITLLVNPKKGFEPDIATFSSTAMSQSDSEREVVECHARLRLATCH